MTATVYMHLFVPDRSKLSGSLRGELGEASDIVQADVDGKCHELLVWTMTEESARQRRLLQRIFNECSFGSMSRWPRAAFSLSPETPDMTELSFGSGAEFEIIGGRAKLWLHFTSDESSRRHGRPVQRVFTCSYSDAVKRGVWGIEEDFIEGGGMTGGWWVTSTPDPGTPPPLSERHGIC